LRRATVVIEEPAKTLSSANAAAVVVRKIVAPRSSCLCGLRLEKILVTQTTEDRGRGDASVTWTDKATAI